MRGLGVRYRASTGSVLQQPCSSPGQIAAPSRFVPHLLFASGNCHNLPVPSTLPEGTGEKEIIGGLLQVSVAIDAKCGQLLQD